MVEEDAVEEVEEVVEVEEAAEGVQEDLLTLQNHPTRQTAMGKTGMAKRMMNGTTSPDHRGAHLQEPRAHLGHGKVGCPPLFMHTGVQHLVSIGVVYLRLLEFLVDSVHTHLGSLYP